MSGAREGGVLVRDDASWSAGTRLDVQAAAVMGVTMVAVFIPVLARPHRVAPLLQSLRASKERGVELVPYFICTPGDSAELGAIREHPDANAIVVDWPAGKGDYARKMNEAFRQTDEEFVFLGADDLRFHPGWVDAALARHRDTKACVVGTNDMGNSRVMSGRHSTHTLVHRDYGECGTVDEEGVLLHEGYWHNFCDDEFIQTAQWRETYTHAGDALVEHLHPNWGKGASDRTYEIANEHFHDDQRYYHGRAKQWRGWN